MTRRKGVLSLENLALEAVTASVLRAARRIVDIKVNSETQSTSCFGKRLVRLKRIRLKWMNQRSHLMWLNRFLYGNLSADLSEKLSVKAIKVIDKLSMDYMCTGSDLISSSERFQTARILKNLTLAVLCPHLAMLNFTELHYLVPQVLWENLPMRLQVLLMGRSLRESTILSGMSQLRNLVSFTMWENCTDRIVTALGETCIQLERLDVSMSMLYVSDASARAVVKLSPKLKELKLCGTGLSQCGFSRILTGLPARTGPEVLETKHRESWSHGLVTFEAQRLSTYHFVLLVQMYPNLVCLRILHVYGDLSVLASLTSLKELEVRHGKLDPLLPDELINLSGFLEQKGSDLTSLVVQTVNFVEVQIICRHCVSLRSLGLYVRQSSQTAQHCCRRASILPRCKPTNIQTLLPKLETLIIYNEDDVNDEKASHLVEFLLSAGCTYVRTIEMYDYGNIDDSFLSRLLEKRRIQHLERFIVGNHLYYHPFGESVINLSFKALRFLLEQCPHLEEVGFLKEWQHISDQELVTLKEELKLNNVNLNLMFRNSSRYTRGTLLRIRSSKEL